MIGKETLNIRYYFELNGLRVTTRYGYFDSEEEAKDFYSKNIKMLKESYSELVKVNDFLLIKEETFVHRKIICKLSHNKYIIQCDTDMGELFVSIIDSINMPYLSPFKSEASLTSSFSSKEEAESIMEEYKIKLKPYYKESILNNMKVIEVEEG